jgi:hypothetical protein
VKTYKLTVTGTEEERWGTESERRGLHQYFQYLFFSLKYFQSWGNGSKGRTPALQT